MRRFFAILILVFLPLQSVWAAASLACTHEEGKSSMHFGHHVHTHHASGDSKKPDGKRLPPGPDNDCSFCHAAPASPSGEFNTWLLPAGAGVISDPPQLHPDSIPELPYRPKWLAAS